MNLNQYIKNRVQNILNERLIQNAQSNIDNNINNTAKKISSVIPVIPYSSIVENIMSKHITDEQLQTLVCEAFKYFETLPNVFEAEDYDDYSDHNGYYLQRQFIVFQESFEPNIKRLIKETGPYDPDIIKLLTCYAYCCKWLELDPIELADADENVFSELFNNIEITYEPDYNYSPGSSGSPETDEFDITKYNSKTVISALDNNWEKKQIIIDNIFEKFFDEELFRSTVSDEDYF